MCRVVPYALHQLCEHVCVNVNVCSLGFFASRHRDQASDAKFSRRGSVRSLLDHIAADTDSNEDSKSVASMEELYTSKSNSRPEVSKICCR